MYNIEFFINNPVIRFIFSAFFTIFLRKFQLFIYFIVNANDNFNIIYYYNIF